ncbi:MAG: ABC transporter ATP-binding protein [Actinomycetales bacterium]|nr:ABC transporter ATP-binding protein [Actinomycetales bacterium]
MSGTTPTPGRRDVHPQGRPDYHDPTGGFGGAPPAHSALTLRLVLAILGLVICVGGIIWTLAVDGPLWLVIALAVLLVVTVIDIAVITARKRRGEPG